MSFIEKLSTNMAKRIAMPLELEEDQQEVVAYGAFILLQSAWSLLLIIIVGLIFNQLLEMLTISLATTILKKYSGGAHATSPNRCAVLGGLVFLILSVVEVNLIDVGNINLMVMLVLGLICTYWGIRKYAPIDSPNKPIDGLQMRKYLNIKSQIVVLLSSVLIIILMIIYFYTLNNILLRVALGILIGLSWQTFTLVPIGNHLIIRLDRLLGTVIP